MSKYHINFKGEASLCRATKQCPFGDLASQHYSSKEDARKVFELSIAGKTLKSSNKNEDISYSSNFDAAKVEEEKLRARRALNPLASKEDLHILSRDESEHVRSLVALHSNIDKKDLEALMKDHSYKVKNVIAAREDLSPIDFNKLVADCLDKDNSENTVGFAINLATNKNSATDSGLKRLLEYPHFDLNHQIARNPKSNEEILDILTKDKNVGTRMLVVRHQNVTLKQLLILSKDPNPLVSKEATQNEKLFLKI